ncbi:MAG: histidine phosphatase family protein [Planctomycetota bacterium]
MRIYLIRHGDPHYPTDSLTEKGVDEARALADYIGTIKPNLLFVSPLGRARQTASYTEAVLNLQAEVLDWTRELDIRANDGSNRMAWDMTPLDFNQPAHQDDPAWQPSLISLAKESDAWIARLGWDKRGGAYHYNSERGIPKTLRVALFCHGGFGLTWLAHLLGIARHQMWSSFFLHTSSVTTILFDEREPGIATPRVIGLSELPHLYHSGFEPSRSGIKSLGD